MNVEIVLESCKEALTIFSVRPATEKVRLICFPL